MLLEVISKLPMRDRSQTRNFYVDMLGFKEVGIHSYPDYLMVQKEKIELHFFLFESLNPQSNYGQVYIRVKDIDSYYEDLLKSNVAIHPNGTLQTKPWGQKEFALLDPDTNLLTFGVSIISK